MSHNYFVRVRGRTLGPYDLPTLRAMVAKAQISRSHEISTDAASWAAASTFPEVFERAQAVVADNGALGSRAAEAAPAVDERPPAGEVPHLASPASTMWHYTLNGEQQANPIDQQTLIQLIISGRVGPEDNVWNETMATWAKVSQVATLAAYALPPASHEGGNNWPSGSSSVFPSLQFPSAPRSRGQVSQEYRAFVGKKTAAGVIALLLGALGVHKFMLGLTTGGLTMLLLCILLVPIPFLSVIAFIEGILYLSKSDEQFFRDYAVDRRQWF
jgi:TM2 domain-containing membrane protein YozV